MSRLTVTPDKTPGQPSLRTEDPAAIAQALAAIGVRFERWTPPATQWRPMRRPTKSSSCSSRTSMG